jgi:hypothetical protein
MIAGVTTFAIGTARGIGVNADSVMKPVNASAIPILRIVGEAAFLRHDVFNTARSLPSSCDGRAIATDIKP